MELKTNTKEDTVLDYRFAFERDKARKQGFVYEPAGVLSECELCSGEYDRLSPRAKYCVGCRLTMKRIRDKVWYWKNGGREHKAQQWVEYVTPNPLKKDQGYQDLAFAVVETAFAEHDYFWLSEFGMEFLAYSGNPINQRKFDGLMEEMVHAKDKQAQADN